MASLPLCQLGQWVLNDSLMISSSPLSLFFSFPCLLILAFLYFFPFGFFSFPYNYEGVCEQVRNNSLFHYLFYIYESGEDEASLGEYCDSWREKINSHRNFIHKVDIFKILIRKYIFYS
jgi:hypothetical protein